MPKISKEWVDAYFAHGVDTANRRVFLNDVDEESIGNIVKGLYLMEAESKDKPCELFISSVGGSVYEALALYDILQTLSCPVHTFAYGKCMSAAPLLLAAGEKGQRWVTENVAFMHHDYSSEIEGRGAFMEGEMRHLNRLDRKWIELLCRHSTKPFAFWQRKAAQSANFYFGAEEAMEWGLADAIWAEKGG